ncbi:uncharacterized protein [Amphiura filiformis]|uniref:uncharacterized protein n=1 Tax=Amphiura filiformis TaxID=82378 RepID=UPI003B20D2BB
MRVFAVLLLACIATAAYGKSVAEVERELLLTLLGQQERQPPPARICGSIRDNNEVIIPLPPSTLLPVGTGPPPQQVLVEFLGRFCELREDINSAEADGLCDALEHFVEIKDAIRDFQEEYLDNLAPNELREVILNIIIHKHVFPCDQQTTVQPPVCFEPVGTVQDLLDLVIRIPAHVDLSELRRRLEENCQ